VVCAFGWRNLKAVASAMRAWFPLRRMIIAADNDDEKKGSPGVTAATAAAREVDCQIAVPPPGDFNDLLKAKGEAAVKKVIDAAD
jgi:phage/plasmid primase-like uncharacterized protein